MGAETLSSRAIIGRFFRTLEQDVGASWIGQTSMEFNSDQPSETYAWLGQSPQMREWIGGRQAKGFTENGITILNKHYEATIKFLLREITRDKTSQVNLRIDELSGRTNSHWGSLLSTLILAGESAVCYDGQFFFDTDHAEGDSGAQSNDLSIDISALPVAVHGTVTAPSVGEMVACILQAIQAIGGFKDDRGEPMNEMATKFLVMTPTPLWAPAVSAVTLPMVDNGNSNVIPASSNLQIEVARNARLTWTDKFAVFRSDSRTKAFIRQNEQPVKFSGKAEGSEYEFDNAAWEFGVDAWRNVGYGFWQDACLVTMT